MNDYRERLSFLKYMDAKNFYVCKIQSDWILQSTNIFCRVEHQSLVSLIYTFILERQSIWCNNEDYEYLFLSMYFEKLTNIRYHVNHCQWIKIIIKRNKNNDNKIAINYSRHINHAVLKIDKPLPRRAWRCCGFRLPEYNELRWS